MATACQSYFRSKQTSPGVRAIMVYERIVAESGHRPGRGFKKAVVRYLTEEIQRLGAVPDSTIGKFIEAFREAHRVQSHQWSCPRREVVW